MCIYQWRHAAALLSGKNGIRALNVSSLILHLSLKKERKEKQPTEPVNLYTFSKENVLCCRIQKETAPPAIKRSVSHGVQDREYPMFAPSPSSLPLVLACRFFCYMARAMSPS